MMISTASSTHQPTSTARHGGVLALEPPRHTKLPVTILVPGKHLIGADSGCHIQIPLDGVHRHHAMVLVGEQKVLLKALDPRTWVNDSVVSETSLRSGDRLSIGPITFRVRLATADELRSMTSLAAEKRTSAEIPAHPPVPAPAPEPQTSDIATSHQPPVEAAVSQTVEVELRVVSPVANALPEPIVELLIAPEAVATETPEILVDGWPGRSGLAEAPEDHAQDRARSLSETPKILVATPIVPEPEAPPLEVIVTSQQPEMTTEPIAIPESELAIREAERIRDDAEYEQRLRLVEESRRELADEFARQTAVWQEWEAAHHRSVEELTQQLQTIAEQRAKLQLQSDGVAGERAELQQLRNELERAQQADAIERRAAAAETERLRAERAAYEADQRMHVVSLEEQMIVLQDREARLASERRSVGAAEEELFAFRKQLEHERTQFAAERAAESVRREQEIRDASAAEQRLSEQASLTQKLRFELQAEQLAFENRLADLQREQDEVAAKRIELNGLQDQLTQAKLDFERERGLAVEKASSIQRDAGLASYLQLEMESRRPAARSGSNRFETDPTSYPTYESPRPPIPLSSLVPPPIPSSERSRAEFHEPPSIVGTSDHLLSAHRLDSGPAIAMSSERFEIRGGAEIGPPTFSLSSSMGGVGDQSLIGHMQSDFSAVNTATALREAQTVSQTLTEVNQQFGLSMPFRAEDFIAQLSSPSTTQVNQPETEQSPVQPHIRLQPLDESPSSSPPVSDILEKDNSLSSLRAQLAQMFDLPKSPQSIASENERDESFGSDPDLREGEAPAEPGTSDTHGLGDLAGASPSLRDERLAPASEFSNEPLVEESFRQSRGASSADDSVTDTQSVEVASVVSSSELESTALTASSSLQSTNENSTAGSAADAASAGDEDAWARRLRELSQHATATSPPEPTPAEEPEPSTEDDEEYSVEAQLARLLGRPQRIVTRPTDTSMSTSEYQAPKGIIGRDLAETIKSATSDQETDRSHLTEQPKHRQDKSAVMHEVQSFRAVAQWSARSALAKHSWNSLRSEIYFKGVLAAVSAGATTWFAANWFYGTEPEVWKALVCALTTLICLERLFHSSSKIRIWKKKNKQELGAKSSAASDTDEDTDA